jgi:hypothetical protein
VDTLLKTWGQKPGVNPSVTNDPGYWAGRIAQTGGINNQSQQDYWTGRFMTPEGAFNDTQGGGGAAAPAGQPGVGNNIHDALSSFLMQMFGGRTDPNAAFRSNLMGQFSNLMGKYSQPVSADDPIIRANADAYHGTRARNLQALQESMAERAHAEGVPTGAFDSAVGNATQTGVLYGRAHDQ